MDSKERRSYSQDLRERNVCQVVEAIEARNQPLGTTMDTECWGAVVIDLAAKQGVSPTAFLEIGEPEFQHMITRNAALRPAARNQTMLRATLEILES